MFNAFVVVSFIMFQIFCYLSLNIKFELHLVYLVYFQCSSISTIVRIKEIIISLYNSQKQKNTYVFHLLYEQLNILHQILQESLERIHQHFPEHHTLQ